MMRVRHGNQNRYNNPKLGRTIRPLKNDDDDHEPKRIRFNPNHVWREVPYIPNQGCLIQCKPNLTARGGTSWQDFTNEFTDPNSLLNQTDDKIRDFFKDVENELSYVFDPNKNGLKELFENFRNGMQSVFNFLKQDKLFNLELDPNKNGVNALFMRFKDDFNGAFQELGQKMLDFYKGYIFPTPLLSLLGRGFKPLGDFFDDLTDKDWWEDKLNDPETYFFIAQSILMCSSAFLGPGGAALAAGVIAAARLITKAAMNEPILPTDILEMGLCLLPQGRIIQGPPGSPGIKSFGQFVMDKVSASIRNLKGADPNFKARAVGQGLCACVAVGQDMGLIPPVNKKGYLKTMIDNSNKDIERSITGETGYKKKYTLYERDQILVRQEPFEKKENGVMVTKMRDVYKQLNSFTTRVIELDDYKDRDLIPKVLAEEQVALEIIEYWKQNKIEQQKIDDYYTNDLTKDIPVDLVSGTDLKTGLPFYMERPKIPNLGVAPKVGNVSLFFQSVPYKKGEFVARTLNSSLMPPKASESAWKDDPKVRIFECMKDTKDVPSKDNIPPFAPKDGETFQTMYEKGTGVWRETTLAVANKDAKANAVVDPREFYKQEAAKYRELYNTMLKNQRYANDLARDRLILKDRLQKDVLVVTEKNGALFWLTYILDNEVKFYPIKKKEVDTTYMLNYHTKYWTNYFFGPNFFKTPDDAKAFYEQNPDEMPEIPEFNADAYGTDFQKQAQLHMERFFKVDFAPINETHACSHFFFLDVPAQSSDTLKETESLVCPFNKTTKVVKRRETTPSGEKIIFPFYDLLDANGYTLVNSKGYTIKDYWDFPKVVDEVETELNRNYTSDRNADDDRDLAQWENLEAYNVSMFNMTRNEKLAYLRKLHTFVGDIIEIYARNKPELLLKDSLIWNKEKKRIDIPSIQVLKQAIPDLQVARITYSGNMTRSDMTYVLSNSDPVFIPYQVAPVPNIVPGYNDANGLWNLNEEFQRGTREANLPQGSFGSNQPVIERGQKRLEWVKNRTRDMTPTMIPLAGEWLEGSIPLKLLHSVFQGVQTGHPRYGIIKELSEEFFIKYFLDQDINEGQRKAKTKYERPLEVRQRYERASPEDKKEIERLEAFYNNYDSLVLKLRERSLGGPPDFRGSDIRDRTIERWNTFKNVAIADRPYTQDELEKKAMQRVKDASTLLAAQDPNFFEIYSTMNPDVITYYMALMKREDAQNGTTVHFDTAKSKQDAYIAKVAKNYDTQRRIRKAMELGAPGELSSTEILLNRLREDPIAFEYEERYRKATEDQRRTMDSWNSPQYFSWGDQQKWYVFDQTTVDKSLPNSQDVTNIMPFYEKIKLARSMQYGYNSDWRAENMIQELEQKMKAEDEDFARYLDDEHSSRLWKIQQPWEDRTFSRGETDTLQRIMTKYGVTLEEARKLHERNITVLSAINGFSRERQNLMNDTSSQQEGELADPTSLYKMIRNEDGSWMDLLEYETSFNYTDEDTQEEEAMMELLRLEDARYTKLGGDVVKFYLNNPSWNKYGQYKGEGKPSKRRKYNKFYKY